MEVDYYDFIIKGEFGNFKFGTPWSDVITLLGDPPLYAPPKLGNKAIAQYGGLQFNIEEEKVTDISLRLDRDFSELPKEITFKNFDYPEIQKNEVLRLLKEHDITWKRIKFMCSDWIDYLISSKGVHLSFGGDRLGLVGACDPNEKWV